MRLLLFWGFLFLFTASEAQLDIKINGYKINRLDKKNRKQGEWIFFDAEGNIRLSCEFRDDACISPWVFYENSDTAFIRLPATDSAEAFVLFKNKKPYFGSFIQRSDSSSVIQIEPDPTLTETIIADIKKYQTITVNPVYFFHQKNLIDYMSASLHSSRFVFNKPVNVLLTISSSGLVTNVEFPKDKNNLNVDEESELFWIYSTMPRWQPFFYKNKILPVKILLSNNTTLSTMSFEH